MRAVLRALAAVLALGTLLTVVDPTSRLTTAREVLFAVGAIATIALVTIAASGGTEERRAAFEAAPPAPRPAPVPRDLGRIVVELRSLDAALGSGPAAAQRARIPTTVRALATAVVDDRLQRRGLSLDSPDAVDPALAGALATGSPVGAATFVELVEQS
jgi:hypothetical protein